MSFVRAPSPKEKQSTTNSGGTSRLQPRSTAASRARMTKNVQLLAGSTCSIPMSWKKDFSSNSNVANKPYKPPVDQARRAYIRSPSYDESQMRPSSEHSPDNRCDLKLIKSSQKPSSQRQARPSSEMSNDSTLKNESQMRPSSEHSPDNRCDLKVLAGESEQRFQLKVVLPTSECCLSTGNETDIYRANSPNIDNAECCDDDDDGKLLEAEQLSDALSLSTGSSQTPKQTSSSECTVKLFNVKKEKFHLIKKELDIKQNAALECYVKIKNMHQSLLEQGENVEPEMKNFKVLDVGNWAMEELLNFCKGHGNVANTGAGEMCPFERSSGEHVIQDTKSKLNEIPLLFVSFFQEILTNRQAVIDWFKGFLERKEMMDTEVDTAIEKVMGEGDCLTVKVNEINETLMQTIDSIIADIKQVCQERALYIGKNESLLKEKAKLDIVVADMKLFNSGADKSQEFEELDKELTLERHKCTLMRERMMQTEGALRSARSRAADLERQLKDVDTTLATMAGTIKNLEQKNRQRETAFDLRARKLHEVNKIGELNLSQLTQQKESLEKKIREQQTEHKASMEKVNKRINELVTELATSTTKLDEATQLCKEECEARLNAQRVAEETIAGTDNLKERLSELQRICGMRDPNQPSEHELELWTELQNTKACLRATEEEVISCKREKLSFLDTLSKIAESDNKMSVQQKLAAELLAKEDTIAKLQTQVHDNTKNLKLTEQKLVQYELQNEKLQQNILALHESKGDIQPISYQELQQEIMNLRLNLVESVHRNEELSEIIIQKDITLEQQEKVSKSTSKVLKTREELITLLRNKEIEQSKSMKLTQSDLENRARMVDEISKQIVLKSSEIQQLFVTLDGKQQQIHKLEAIVLALEEQHRRGQAQRTRHEEKIAILEHELAELRNGKNTQKRFLLF